MASSKLQSNLQQSTPISPLMHGAQHHLQSSQQQVPLPGASLLALQQTPLPPLPPRPVSPNASSSCSTQITTVRTSPGPQAQPALLRAQTTVGPADVPPPLPPLNQQRPGVQSLLQAQLASVKASANYQNTANSSELPRPASGVAAPTTTTTQQQQQQQQSAHLLVSNSTNDGLNLINLNFQRGGIVTDAERKTEQLTRQVELELERQNRAAEALGVCPKCNEKVLVFQEACKAMNEIYHANCFVCCECGRTLLGKTFYPVGERVYCEEDFNYTGHMQSLERCAACSQPIFNMILPAMDKSYHPKCFKCCICGQCLDGIPFTIDHKSKIYCVEDYHK